MYFQEEFTTEEKDILLNHFSNIDKPVFCLINMPEVVKEHFTQDIVGLPNL